MKNSEKLREEPLAREEIFHGRIVHLVRDTVRLPNGKEATREVILHPGACGIVPLFEDGTVLMEYQYRHPHGRIVYEIPAGKLDGEGEDPLAAAKRELREETGYTAKKWTPLGTYAPSPAILGEVITLYLAEELVAGDTAPDEDEFLLTERRPLCELVDAVLAGEITDGKTQVALLKTSLLKERQSL